MSDTKFPQLRHTTISISGKPNIITSQWFEADDVKDWFKRCTISPASNPKWYWEQWFKRWFSQFKEDSQ